MSSVGKLDPVFLSDTPAAAAYWRDRPTKKWRVDVTAGPATRPSFARTFYASGADRDAAVRAVRRHMVGVIPRSAHFAIRLAGPRELGCVETPGAGCPS